MANDDDLLAATDVEEAYSVGFVGAVAAGAGYVVSTKSFDRDGIDMTIEAGGHLRPKLDVQLKASINVPLKGKVLKYPLKMRNYDLLRFETQTPRILVVLHLPKDQNDWLNITPEELAIRGCAYWRSLVDEPEVENDVSTTIDIPVENRFDVASLKKLMELSRTGRIK